MILKLQLPPLRELFSITFKERIMAKDIPEIGIDELMAHLHPMQPHAGSYLLQIDKDSTIGKLMALWEPRLKVDRPSAADTEVHLGQGVYTHVGPDGKWTAPSPDRVGEKAQEGDRRWFVLPTTASDLLRRSVEIMDERAKEYDSEEQGGERSMAATVAAFNAIIKDNKLSESEGWLFMQCLKLVRDRSTASGHKDSIEDNVAYAALYGEARLAEGRAAADAKSAERMTALIKKNITADTDGAPQQHTEESLRGKVCDVLIKVKNNFGTQAARALISHYGLSKKLCDIADADLPVVLAAAYRHHGENLAVRSYWWRHETTLPFVRTDERGSTGSL